MKVILENQQITLKLDTIENENCGAYLPELFRSNKVNGMYTYDAETDTHIIQGYGTNDNIYSALMQIQEETEQNHYTIE